MEKLQNVLDNASRSIVGKLCRQAEILIDSSSNEETKEKLNLLKSFNKELIYQEFRTVLEQINNAKILRSFKPYAPKR